MREIYFPTVGFIANGLFWSFTTLIITSGRMNVRGVTWNALGLSKPENVKNTLMVTGFILICIPASIIIFEIIKNSSLLTKFLIVSESIINTLWYSLTFTLKSKK